MTDIRQNRKYAEYLKLQNWIVEEHDGVFYYIKKILFFSVMKLQRPREINYKEIKRLNKKYRAVQVIIEPWSTKEAKELIKKGWQQVDPFIPSKTIILDLSKSEEKIYDSFDKDTRYSIRRMQNVAGSMEECKDINLFRKYWKAAVDYKRHVLSTKQLEDLKRIFTKDSLFLIADDGVSGGIFLVAGDVGYYWYGFVDKEGRKKLSQYKVLWEGIKWARSRSAKYFDMEGIYDERFPIPTWQGFTKFKLGFGGKVVKYPGAYQKIVLPL
ncbi:hypothetical protein A2803_05475 [Candidatus Woesebacteria bacterium RIFCSPHIGHO2_01_FULL_44_21]|uniref:BioF2-like acetyltransferase domain-containing protein n=1 Tax=Candidatus Woesebacteria bacterium RIFCSPHIGHO2_01_FULL_44_21 TaxID=1802503 RepID=A0A1F7YW60_9BACT|nr:MAG: hypothetical protein A2803_05475 [Candidatus Woesebacteria bacterium RIFCSPHIGHO2_01_FULL_44_21]OGM68783.1 MAG: hypothetical protein A2897_01270 [Candidatus Woesebacteria bacterium RIFCSPLOWO2_01_FULL_44_24b]